MRRLTLLAFAASVLTPSGARAALPEAEMADTAPPRISLTAPELKAPVPARTDRKLRKRRAIVLRPVVAPKPAEPGASREAEKPAADRDSSKS
jgi:hypothetical protein